MINTIAGYVLGMVLFVMICALVRVDYQLMLALLNDVSYGRFGLPRVELVFDHLPSLFTKA